MLKKVIITFLLLSNLFAIGGLDSLAEDEKDAMLKIQESLQISKEDTFQLY